MMLNLGLDLHSHKIIHDLVKQLQIINVCLYIYYIYSDTTAAI
jgi:hypothetical protein